MDKLKISIIVLNFNGIEDTLECLDSISRLNKHKINLEVIVVDNNSRDGSQKKLSNIKDIKLILNNENLGYTGGNNIGIKKALADGAQYCLLLNNDTILNEDLLVNLLAKIDDILSPKIYFAPGFEFHPDRYKKGEIGKVIWYAGGKIDWDNIIGSHIGVDEVDVGQFDTRREIDMASGSCMLVSKNVLEKIGLFDEKYFLYLEDMDFCVRAKRAGFKITYEPKAHMWHKNASSSGGSGSELQDYYITRNRLLFAFKYAKLKTKIALLRQITLQAASPIRRKALIDFLTFNFGQGSYKI